MTATTSTPHTTPDILTSPDTADSPETTRSLDGAVVRTPRQLGPVSADSAMSVDRAMAIDPATRLSSDSGAVFSASRASAVERRHSADRGPSALTAAEQAFELLVCQPAPLAFDARAVPGLPGRHIGLDELRDLLTGPGVDYDTSDAVWRLLADHARTWGPAWVVAAVGVALPGLTRINARLAYGRAAQADDICSEVLTGFLHALRNDPLDTPRVWLRLCWAAWRSGQAARRIDDTEELPGDLHTESTTRVFPTGIRISCSAGPSPPASSPTRKPASSVTPGSVTASSRKSHPATVSQPPFCACAELALNGACWQR